MRCNFIKQSVSRTTQTVCFAQRDATTTRRSCYKDASRERKKVHKHTPVALNITEYRSWCVYKAGFLQHAQRIRAADALAVPHQETPVPRGASEQLLRRGATQIPVIPERRSGGRAGHRRTRLHRSTRRIRCKRRTGAAGRARQLSELLLLSC